MEVRPRTAARSAADGTGSPGAGSSAGSRGAAAALAAIGVLPDAGVIAVIPTASAVLPPTTSRRERTSGRSPMALPPASIRLPATDRRPGPYVRSGLAGGRVGHDVQRDRRVGDGGAGARPLAVRDPREGLAAQYETHHDGPVGGRLDDRAAAVALDGAVTRVQERTASIGGV